MKLTRRQELGTKFEIFVEEVLKGLGHQGVIRNVEYHKSKNLYRQVDVAYLTVNNSKVQRNIIECKFSSNGPISYDLRAKKIKTINRRKVLFDNLVDETLERRNFVGADNAYLVTNKNFEPKLIYEAKKKGLKLLSGKELAHMCSTSQTDLQNNILGISVYKYNLHNNVIYLS